MSEKKELELRSEEVQDILSQIPHWMIRWGNVLIFSLIILVFIFSWLIKYPDILSSEITITTAIPPEKIVASTTGRIEKILVEDRDFVKNNTALAIIENPAKYEDVFYLKSIVDTINPSSEEFNFPIYEIPLLYLGPIETAYAVFERDYLTYLQHINYQPHQINLLAHHKEALQLVQQRDLLLDQKKISEKELEFKKTELERYQFLFEKGVISSQEWEQKNVEYLQQEKAINSLQAQIVQLYSTINDLQRNEQTTSVNQSKDDINLLRNAVLSYNQLKKAILDWELLYVLRSSITGQVSFMHFWVENQTVNAGEDTFVVIPNEMSDLIGKIKAPILNSGKIKKGQEVHIRLANYPDREFGIIKGKVKSISLTPDRENNLLIDVKLPNGLLTSYKKEITFHQEMSGSANVITEDLRLIERLLYQFRDFFKR